MWVLGKMKGIWLIVASSLNLKVKRQNRKENTRDTILTSRVVEASIDGQSTFGMEGTSQVPKPTCLRGPCLEGTNAGEKEKERKVEKLQIMEAASTLRWKQTPLQWIWMRNMRFLKVPVYVNQRFIFLYFYFFLFNFQEPFECETIGRFEFRDQFASHELRGLWVGNAGKSSQRRRCHQQGVTNKILSQELRSTFFWSIFVFSVGQMSTSGHPLFSRSKALSGFHRKSYTHSTPSSGWQTRMNATARSERSWV